MKKAKEDWIDAQCEEIETCLNKNNSKTAYQLVKDLTSEKQSRSSTITGQRRYDNFQKLTQLSPRFHPRLVNVLLKKKRFSAGGQKIAQNCTTMRVVETMKNWTAVSPQKKICKRSSVRKLRLL